MEFVLSFDVHFDKNGRTALRKMIEAKTKN
jgi:hypothetical protein